MLYRDPHVSDQDLLMVADGELSRRRQGKIQAHLQTCWQCRSRMAEVERNIGEFMHEYQALFDPPPVVDSEDRVRQLLLRSVKRPNFVPHWRWAAAAAVLLLVCSAMALLRQRSKDLIVPNPYLTPGEVSFASKREVCQGNSITGAQPLPEALKEQVFAEYGMKNAPRGAYEVDFLITPELGGSASIRNLWPQPYFQRAWNARVKDVLEERLHSLVCDGNLDLTTAQREIATNWVDAYKKYVRRN